MSTENLALEERMFNGLVDGKFCRRRVEDGRTSEVFVGANIGDKWRDDGSCSYCGSMHPDELMKRLEAGTVELGPTDKSYKVYVENKGGEGFKRSHRDCYAKDEKGNMLFDEHRRVIVKEPVCHGPNDCTHWVTEERNETKFYFQHFSKAQMIRFIELLNEKKLKIGYPGHFYARPFFIAPREA